MVSLEEECQVLKTGINKIIKVVEGSEELYTMQDFSDIYTTVYNMCAQQGYSLRNKYMKSIYNVYVETFYEYINDKVIPAMKRTHDEFMLRELVRRWDNHKEVVRRTSRVFNRFHQVGRWLWASGGQCPDLNDEGLKCFIPVFQEMKMDAKNTVSAMVNKDREGEHIDRTLLRKVLDIFVKMGMGTMDAYQVDFESPMLLDAASYYARKAALWIDKYSCPQYVLEVSKCLEREMERSSHYLHITSKQKVLEIVQQELLSRYQQRLLENGFHELTRNGMMDDLSRMYKLFSGIPQGLEPIAAAFSRSILKEGEEVVKQAKDNHNTHGNNEHFFVNKLLKLHNMYRLQVTECFEDRLLFLEALRKAFIIFCNKSIRENTSSELLARFCHSLMKESGRQKLSDNVENTLEKIVKLLDYIDDKDMFAEFYKKKLAERLLDRRVNHDQEMSMLTKLKQQYGVQYTSNMERMAQDITLSSEMHTKYQNYLVESPQSNSRPDLIVNVLTMSAWPTCNSPSIALPSEMVNCVQSFNEFYKQETNSRKLTWMHSLGTCTLAGKFKAKKIQLVVTTCQAALLLLFNTSETLTYSDVKDQLNVTDKDVVRLLHSVSCGKYKILKKIPDTETVGSDDTFEFNDEFTDKMPRIKIPLPPVDEREKVKNDVDKDRSYIIDACIVRIMKSRKRLTYQELASECVEQLAKTFKPDVKMIKKSIESLILREFLERDKIEKNFFNYLA